MATNAWQPNRHRRISARPGYHDWTNILGDLGLLHRDAAIASVVNGLGLLLMLTALAWAGLLLYRQFRANRS